ncbi:MAG: Stp1/IreP family PP2C-type Ser/Thr phosphatase [Bacilli bacterium]|nr:Stp1/IreP family PP2C-type Ser/Thr phosphatase [Bacilli bacterium]
MNIVEKVDIGNTREINQDYVGYKQISDNEAFLVVCDGMGGHNAGEVASYMAGQYILECCSLHDEFSNEEEIKAWLHYLINNANRIVHEKSLTDEHLKGMGTTVVLAYIKDHMLYVAHVGDSRAYLVDDTIERLTVDDTLVNALVKSGSISEEEAQFHPRKNILLQAIGVSTPLKISFYEKELNHQAVLLCSDGLYNSLSEERIKEIFHAYSSLEERAVQLIEQAKIYGGYDNIGLVIADKEELSDESH